MRADFSPQALAAGLLAAFVGFASSFTVILAGLTAAGASQAQAASGLMALSISMGVCAIVVSLWTRQPISIAWSTPGAALMATSHLTIGFGQAVAAFLVTGVLIVVAGLFKPLGRWVAMIPAPLANAMLAGVLLGLCLAPVHAVADAPLLGLAVVVTWAVVAKFRRLFAVPAAVVVAFALSAITAPAGIDLGSVWPRPVLVTPVFDVATIVSVALPLFIVTMASQNIPGMAVLSLNGVYPDAGRMFRVTGLFTLFAAPFGGHAVNLAAITAALCAGPDAHPDPKRRYWAATVAGVAYIFLGLLAGVATAAVRAAPPLLIEAVAGLALMGAFAGALLGAVSSAEDREAAVVTFLVAASGLTLFGIGGAFWGLLAGLALRALSRT